MSPPRPEVPLALLAVVLGACQSGLPPPEIERFSPASLVQPSDYPDSLAVRLIDRGELSFSWDQKLEVPLARLRRLHRVQLLRAGGERWGQLAVPVEPTTRVLGLRMRATWPDGHREETTDTRAVQMPSGVPGLLIQIPGVEPGVVVEAVWDTWYTDPRFVPPWRFDDELPTRRSELALVTPPGFSVDFRFSRDGAFVDLPPDRFETPRGVRFTWSLSDLPARRLESEMPGADLLAPRAHVGFRNARSSGVEGEVDISGFRTWDELGSWVLSKQPEWTKLSTATANEAARVAGDLGESEQALRILEVVARDLPEAIEPVPPLWRSTLPHPDQVLAEQKATPTSRGLLLVALLRSVGLPALPVLYARRNEDILLPDFPDVRSLDGIAAALPRESGLLFFDPSELTVSDRVPPPSLQGQRVVVLRSDVAEVTRVPVAAPEESRTEVRFALRLDPRGDVFGELEARLTGSEAGLLRARLLDSKPDGYAALVGAFLAERGASLLPKSVSIADLRVLRRPLVITGTIDEKRLIQGEGEQLFIPFETLLGKGGPLPKEVRRAPRIVGPPRETRMSLTLTLPDDWAPSFVPNVTTLTGPAGVSVTMGARKETEQRMGFVFEERRSELLLSEEEHRAWRAHEDDRAAARARTFGIERPPQRTLEY